MTCFASLSNSNYYQQPKESRGDDWQRLSTAVVTAVDEYTDLMRVASMMCALRQFHSAEDVSILLFILGPDVAFANELNAHASNEQFSIIKEFVTADAQLHLRRDDVPAVDAKPVVIAEALLTHELVVWMNPGIYVTKPMDPIFNFLSNHG